MLLSARVAFAAAAATAILAFAPAASADEAPLRVTVEAGPAAVSIEHVTSLGGRVALGLAPGRYGVVGIALLAEGGFAETGGGLPVRTFALAMPIDAKLGPLRLGAGPELTITSIGRSSAGGEGAIDTWGLGGLATASVDLFPLDGQDRAVFVALRADASSVRWTAEPFVWSQSAWQLGGALTLGARF